MPAIVLGKPQQSEAMWQALKNHIVRARQRKKEEQEAEVEEERQRKERERQQKQDVMTLGETREQIAELELKLAQLKDEKHQLFLQLKKVLNEDDNRRRQLVKESSEMMNMHGYPPMGIGGHHQIFLQQNMGLGRGPIYKVAPHHGGPHTLIPPPVAGHWYLDHCPPGSLKRSHSPSPPPQAYHHPYAYKQATLPGFPPPKMEDGRRGPEYVRAVLWNKNVQYSNSQSYYSAHPAPVPASSNVAYTPAPAATIYTYTTTQPYGQPPHVGPPREETVTKPAPHIYLGQPRGSVTTGSVAHPPQPAYITPIHHSVEQSNSNKQPGNNSFTPVSEAASEKFYPSGRPATHVSIHGNAIPIQQAPQGNKTGSITSGYPIRGQPVLPTSHSTTTNYQPATTAAYQPATTAAYQPATTAAYQPATTAAYQPATTAAYQPATTASYQPATTASYQPTTASYPPTTASYPPTTASYPPSTTAAAAVYPAATTASYPSVTSTTHITSSQQVDTSHSTHVSQPSNTRVMYTQSTPHTTASSSSQQPSRLINLQQREL